MSVLTSVNWNGGRLRGWWMGTSGTLDINNHRVLCRRDSWDSWPLFSLGIFQEVGFSVRLTAAMASIQTTSLSWFHKSAILSGRGRGATAFWVGFEELWWNEWRTSKWGAARLFSGNIGLLGHPILNMGQPRAWLRFMRVNRMYCRWRVNHDRGPWNFPFGWWGDFNLGGGKFYMKNRTELTIATIHIFLWRWSSESSCGCKTKCLYFSVTGAHPPWGNILTVLFRLWGGHRIFDKTPIHILWVSRSMTQSRPSHCIQSGWAALMFIGGLDGLNSRGRARNLPPWNKAIFVVLHLWNEFTNNICDDKTL